MRLIGLLVVCASLAAVFAGCTEPSRDLNTEAKEREEWAKENNAYRPVAVLTGPERIAPGALVWFSAHGSHDPDFFGATNGRERREAQEAGGVHVRDDASEVQWSWYVFTDTGDTRGLGNGIRSYEWHVDDRPALVAPELTHRYGSEDGPIRFPLGFTEPGTHELRLVAVDWNGERAEARMTIEVAEGGIGSTIPGWAVTEEGWVHEHMVPVSWQQYGECPPILDHYDAQHHRLAVPWDLFFFMGEAQFEARWARDEVPAARAATDVLPGLAAQAAPGVNLNDVAFTLGHCARDNRFATFDTDQALLEEDPVEVGTIDGESLASKVEITGALTERRAEWDINVYLSDRGDAQWGRGVDVTFRTIFQPAGDTRHGGL